MSVSNNSNLPENQYEVKTLFGKFLSDFNHIELPSAIENNLIRSICKLTTGLVDIPLAYLHEYKRRIERETEALDILSRANVESIVDFNKKDSEFIATTANYYSMQQFKEAGNRRSVLEKVIYELGDKTISEDAKEQIDEDWLSRFAKIANDVSKEEVQLLLARILAGEITKPGSFSTMTLKVLDRMDKRVADQFTSFASHCSYVSSGSNTLILTLKDHRHPYSFMKRRILVSEITSIAEPNLSPQFDEFSLLLDIGILRPIITTRAFLFSDLKAFQVGSNQVNIVPYDELHTYQWGDNHTVELKCMELTIAGIELLPLIKLTPPPQEYTKELNNHFIRSFGHKLDYPGKE